MEANILEAREEFNGIFEFVLAEATDSEIHNVEREIFRRLLRLGRSLLKMFLRSVETGREGSIIEGPDGSIMRYQLTKVRQYLSVFGQVSIKRA